jgi:uncharacterized membrane protein
MRFLGAEVLLLLLGLVLLWLVIGLVVAIYSVFALLAVTFSLHRGLEPFAAAAASAHLIGHNAGTTVLLSITLGLLIGISYVLCGVGLLVTVPIAAGAMVHA